MAETKYLIDHTELMVEWDWEKNNALNLDPHTLTQGCHTIAWWRCTRGHSYEAQIRNRVSGYGCPYCAGKKVMIGYNDLETFYPDVAKDWNYDKNGILTPTTITYASNKKVWWRCSTCSGEYEASVVNRTKRGSACPYCANQKVLVGYNDLQSQSPELAAEWSDMNTIQPTEVTPHSNKKVYWRCALGHEDYLMSIKNRSNRQGCPICAQQSQTSFPEQAIYYYIKQIFPDVINRYIFENREIDIFIPSRNIGIEYNGYFSHKQKEERDAAKKEFFLSVGITLLVVKEFKNSTERNNADFYIHERTSYKNISSLIKEILSSISAASVVDVDCERDAITIKNQYISLRKESSVASIRPDLIDRWDYEKNGSITPDMITLGTGQRFYWKCKICGRSYLALPSRIAGGSVCAKHRNLLKNPDNNLASKHPELLEYWDYEKNSIAPFEVYGGGERIVYWKCKKGHSYRKSILEHIRGGGCPVCAGKRVLTGFNDLATISPEIAVTWNYARNGDTLPTQVTAHSNKRFWWICEYGHEWESTVNNRMKSKGCPKCYRLRQGSREINLYDAETELLIGTFASVRSLCEYLGLNYTKMNGAISKVCRRKQETLMQKYIVRNADDDEFILK